MVEGSVLFENNRECNSKEDEFAFKLVSEFSTLGSHTGFVYGSFEQLIKHMRLGEVSEELIMEAIDVLKLVEAHIEDYGSIREIAIDNWLRLNSPVPK